MFAPKWVFLHSWFLLSPSIHNVALLDTSSLEYPQNNPEDNVNVHDNKKKILDDLYASSSRPPSQTPIFLHFRISKPGRDISYPTNGPVQGFPLSIGCESHFFYRGLPLELNPIALW